MSISPDILDVAVRSWAPPEGWHPKNSSPTTRRPELLVVFDTETRLDAKQSLLIGAYRYVRVAWDGPTPTFSTAEEGLFLPDDADEETRQRVRRYAAARAPSVDGKGIEFNPDLMVLSRHEFCERLLWDACWRNRATLVGFNLAFDVSRLALSFATGQRTHGGIDWYGSWSLRLWEHEEADGTRRDHRFRPNVRIRRLDSKRGLYAWGGVDGPPDDGEPHQPRDDHFLDLRTLVFALTNEGHSLVSASRLFGVPYVKQAVELGRLSTELIDYCREDVTATTRLAQAAIVEFRRHPVWRHVSVDHVLSPATIGNGYLRQARIKPPLLRHDSLDDTHLAQAMAAFYGPRVEVRIRHVEVPITLVDFSGQYVNVARLSGLSRLLTAKRQRLEHDPAGITTFLEGADLSSVFKPATWPRLVGVAKVVPNGEDLPVRAYFSGAGDLPRVGVGPVYSDRPGYYMLADILAGKLITGRLPLIEDAWWIRPEGLDPHVRPVAIRNKVPFHPDRDDLLACFLKAREVMAGDPLSVGVKTIGNGGIAYGTWVRFDTMPRPGQVVWHRPDGRSEKVKVAHPEQPAPFTYPLFAAMATAGGRLLMAALGALVNEAGTTWAAANTDSAAILSTPEGGLVGCPGGPEHLRDGTEAIKVITWDKVDAIAERFDTIGVHLNLTPENFDEDGQRRQLYVLGVSGSRALYYAKEGGKVVAVKVTEGGLGDLRNPLDGGATREWTRDLPPWARSYLVEGRIDKPAWFDVKATSHFPISTPRRMADIGGYGSPLGFVMAARRARAANSVIGGERRRLVAPLLDDPARWDDPPWFDPSTDKPPVIGDADFKASGGVLALTAYGEEMLRWLLHPEVKMQDQKGIPCRANTKGLLFPRAVRIGVTHYVGRESNDIEEVEAGEITSPDEVLTSYGDDAFEALVVPVLRAMTPTVASKITGLRRQTVAAATREVDPVTPAPATRARLTEVAVTFATSELAARGLFPPSKQPPPMAQVLLAWRALAARSLCQCGCGDPVTTPGSKYFSSTHRERAKARRRRAQPGEQAGPLEPCPGDD